MTVLDVLFLTLNIIVPGAIAVLLLGCEDQRNLITASDGPKVTTRPPCLSCGASELACEGRRFVSPRGCCPECTHVVRRTPIPTQPRKGKP